MECLIGARWIPPSFTFAISTPLQVNSLQQVIKLTKENLDKLEGQFLNVQHPPSIFLEVGESTISYTVMIAKFDGYEYSVSIPVKMFLTSFTFNPFEIKIMNLKDYLTG